MNRNSGQYLRSSTSPEPFLAFLPSPLPPTPPLEITFPIQQLLEQANRALGRLDGIGTLLPDMRLFLYSYIRKEALLSSQIEGTQSSFSDLLLYESKEAPGVPLDDVQEVSNYVAAMEHGLKRIARAFRFRCGLFVSFMRSCSRELVAAINHRVNSGGLRIGLVVPAPTMPVMFPPRRKNSWSVSAL